MIYLTISSIFLNIIFNIFWYKKIKEQDKVIINITNAIDNIMKAQIINKINEIRTYNHSFNYSEDQNITLQ